MGLGLFIVRSFLAEAGGRIVATPAESGADVALHLRAAFAGSSS
jgi:C4-dicarboxylate-specific signal transduction histidine kinase